jgi:membrane-bound lytic murein transglycosylase B
VKFSFKTRTAALVACLMTSGAALAHGVTYDKRPEGVRLIQTLEKEHGVDPARARAILSDAAYQQSVIDKMSRPAEKRLTWSDYRPIFVQPDRAEDGAAFVRKHRALFERAEAEYGVPAHIISAIVGVETRYGAFIGKDRVLDALATLGFDYPPRAKFFYGQLGDFIRLSAEEDIDPNTAVGSYAGAMGLPQFIPSSYLAYAVDFNDNGKRDLWNEPADIIGSVANYFAEHGWRRDEPVADKALDQAIESALERSRRETRYRYADLAAQDIRVSAAPAADFPVGLVELETTEGPEFWVGYHNFFVITDYNHSRMYAMAVFQLGELIRQNLAEEG